jgi:hypothetical protein
MHPQENHTYTSKKLMIIISNKMEKFQRTK